MSQVICPHADKCDDCMHNKPHEKTHTCISPTGVDFDHCSDCIPIEEDIPKWWNVDMFKAEDFKI